MYFSKIDDPGLESRSTYKLECIFFIILTAVVAGANSINQFISSITLNPNRKHPWFWSLLVDACAINF